MTARSEDLFRVAVLRLREREKESLNFFVEVQRCGMQMRPSQLLGREEHTVLFS